MFIGAVDVSKHDALDQQKHREDLVIGELFWTPTRAFSGAQEHRNETLICAVDPSKPEAQTHRRSLGGSCDRKALLEASACLVGAQEHCRGNCICLTCSVEPTKRCQFEIHLLYCRRSRENK